MNIAELAGKDGAQATVAAQKQAPFPAGAPSGRMTAFAGLMLREKVQRLTSGSQTGGPLCQFAFDGQIGGRTSWLRPQEKGQARKLHRFCTVSAPVLNFVGPVNFLQRWL